MNQIVGSTKTEPFDKPVFNEVVNFEVAGDDDMVRLLLFDNERQVPLECRLGLRDMRQWMEDVHLPIKELWFALDTPGKAM